MIDVPILTEMSAVTSRLTSSRWNGGSGSWQPPPQTVSSRSQPVQPVEPMFGMPTKTIPAKEPLASVELQQHLASKDAEFEKVTRLASEVQLHLYHERAHREAQPPSLQLGATPVTALQQVQKEVATVTALGETIIIEVESASEIVSQLKSWFVDNSSKMRWQDGCSPCQYLESVTDSLEQHVHILMQQWSQVQAVLDGAAPTWTLPARSDSDLQRKVSTRAPSVSSLRTTRSHLGGSSASVSTLANSTTRSTPSSSRRIPLKVTESKTCPHGHGLTASTDEMAACDICHARVSVGVTRYCCRICDFDLCKKCYEEPVQSHATVTTIPVVSAGARPAITSPASQAVLTLPPHAVKTALAPAHASRTGMCFTPMAASATEPQHMFPETPYAVAVNALGFGAPPVLSDTTAALPPTATNTPRAATAAPIEVPVTSWTGTTAPTAGATPGTAGVTPRAAGELGASTTSTAAFSPTAPSTPAAAGLAGRLCIDVDAWSNLEAPPTFVLGQHSKDVWQRKDVHGESFSGSDEDCSRTGIVDADGSNIFEVDNGMDDPMDTPLSLFGEDSPVFAPLISMKLIEPRGDTQKCHAMVT